MKIFNFHIISDKKLKNLEKTAYLKGLNTGDRIGYQRCRMDMTGKGAILKGYDINDQANNILKGKEKV